MKNPALVRTMAGTVAVRALLSRLFLGLATAGTEALASSAAAPPAATTSSTFRLGEQRCDLIDTLAFDTLRDERCQSYVGA